MNEAMTTYFEGEKNAGLMIAGIGAAVMIGALVLFPSKWELRAFSITLMVFALIELAIGIGLYFKTGPQVAKLVAQLAADSAAFWSAEPARMEKVQRNFVYLEYTWLTLLPLCAAIAVWKKEHLTINGIALGFVLNVAIVLAFDIIAERRGATYLRALQTHAAAKH
jgi:hypothetical protein